MDSKTKIMFESFLLSRHLGKLAAAPKSAFPRDGRYFVLRDATFETVYVFNIAKMSTVFSLHCLYLQISSHHFRVT